MDDLKEFCGYLLGVAFCLMAIALCAAAWVGLEDQFGWRLALGGVALSLLIRINFPLIVGLYLYASNVWGWGMPESITFALPGFLLFMPSIAVEVFGTLVSVAARR
ncbi:hypothetical protein [Sandarakinorhabdus glacialis]|nr:hypothetical protein [Polymorphobacter glacialis]